MLQFTAVDGVPDLNMFIVPDDADREYEHQSGAEEAIAAATQNSWLLVSMKNDFASVYPGTAKPADANAPAVGATAPVPLADAFSAFEPTVGWQKFCDLAQILRPSHHEEQVRSSLTQFGRDLGLETIVDAAGNLLNRKPAGPDMDDLPGVIFQTHLVVAPQKAVDSTHDFLTDPIDAHVDGEWVVTDGTTMVVDNGIGMPMAIRQAKTRTFGSIEALESADKPYDFIPLPYLSFAFQADGLLATLMASVDFQFGCIGTRQG